MAVTLKMLAKETGFSPATISRVLNNDPTISVGEQTRRIIFDTAQRLGYAGGSGRRTQRIVLDAMTIGIAEMLSPAEQMSDPYFLYLKNFVEQSCYERKMQTVALRADENGYRAIDGSDIHGIIAIGYFTDAQIESLQHLCSNITFLDSSPDELLYDSVILNFELGIRQALDYLRSLGHTQIGYIGPKRLIDETKRMTPEPRRRSFEHYMREVSLYHPDFVVECPMRDRSAVETELTLRMKTFYLDEHPTAFVTVNEETAIGTIHALHGLGFHVPNDISIVSFNDTVMSSVVEPALTSISPHLDYMAATAVQLVRQRASSPLHQPERHFTQKIVIPPALVLRESTAAPVQPL